MLVNQKTFLLGGLAAMAWSAALLGCGGGGDSTENPTPTPTPTPPNRKIVYVYSASGKQDDQDIYIMNADGSGKTRLTNDSIHDDDPALSPDGTKILFTRTDETSQPNIYSMSVDGTNMQRIVARGTNLFEPRWSGDGSKFVFWDFSRRVIVANADGSGAAFVPNATSADSPDFSPDGTKIVYSHSTERNLYIINADGTGKTQLTSTDGIKEYRPRWSPNGARLTYFTEVEGQPSQIWVLNVDGSGGGPIRTEVRIHKPSWSSNGTRIIYASWGNDNLYSMNTDGTEITPLTAETGESSSPSW
jgi:Tol biopolymer transport system component